MSLRREFMNYIGTGAIGGIAGYYVGAQGLLGIQSEEVVRVPEGEDQSNNKQDENNEEDTTSREETSPLVRIPLNGDTAVNKGSGRGDFSVSAYHFPETGVSGRFSDAWRMNRNLQGAGPDAVTFDTPQNIDFDFSGNHNFSVKAHFNPNSLSGPSPRQTRKDHPNPYLFQTYAESQVNVQLNNDDNSEIGFSIDSPGEGEGFYSSTGDAVPLGEWTSFVMTWNSSSNTAKLYINGTLELTENLAGPFESKINDDQPTISGFGARAGRDSQIADEGDKGFDGRMDELQIYDTTLTAEQANTLHTQPTL